MNPDMETLEHELDLWRTQWQSGTPVPPTCERK